MYKQLKNITHYNHDCTHSPSIVVTSVLIYFSNRMLEDGQVQEAEAEKHRVEQVLHILSDCFSRHWTCCFLLDYIHNFRLEGPIPTIQTFFCSLQLALSHGTLKSKLFFCSNLVIFRTRTMD